MAEFWFKAMKVTPYEIGIEAQDEEEARAVLDTIYGDQHDPSGFWDSKIRLVPVEAPGVVVGEMAEAPVMQDRTTIHRLSEILQSSWSRALDWAFDNGLTVDKLADPLEEAETNISHERAQQVADADGAHLLYIPAYEGEVLSRLDPTTVLDMYAARVGHNSIIEFHGELQGGQRERRVMYKFLSDDSIHWPSGITIRQYDGRAQVVDRGGNVWLSTF